MGKLIPSRNQKKTIVRLVNRRYCKKALLNRKKLSNLDNTKYNFSNSTKIFINENLTRMNESLAYEGRNLKRKGVISACYTRNGVVHVKKTEHSKADKIRHINDLYELFPNHVTMEVEEDEFHDVSQVANESAQSSY